MDKTPQNHKGNGKKADPATATSWTIMLYIVADDALSNFAVESLKQLHKSASALPLSTDKASVTVAAHFSFPRGAKKKGAAGVVATANETTHEYIFKARASKTHVPSHVLTLPKRIKLSEKTATPKEAATAGSANPSDQVNTAEKEKLKAFLKAVYKNPDLTQSEHYALILWGHGPELLLQPPAGNPASDPSRHYLPPYQLRDVLTEFKPPKGRCLDIIGFDACSMSMFEMAYDIRELATYMVASQEEVPDLSFPYDNLVELFRKYGNDSNSLFQKGVEAYVRTYRDCICNNNTGMNPVTLSVLNLRHCEELKNAVKSLSCALLKAREEEGLPDRLIKARKSSRDYVGGLYVDLYDFCSELSGQLTEINAADKWMDIRNACQEVKDALTEGKPNSLLQANSDDKRGHGISIYLPYLTDEQTAKVERPLVKGGTHLGGAKDFSDILNGAATDYLMSARRDLILVTEGYYDRLQLAPDTDWYSFITKQWTRALIQTDPAKLDFHYSAQQSSLNLARTPTYFAEPCEPAAPPSIEQPEYASVK